MTFCSRRGQSLVELLVGIGVGAIFVIGAATVIAPSLLANKQAGNISNEAQLGQELEKNVQAWSGQNWSGVLALATGTANPYVLNTATSPFTVTSATASPLTIVLVQATSTENYSGTPYPSVSAQFGTGVTSGDTVVVAVDFSTDGSDEVTGCSDPYNATSSYQEAVSVINNGPGQGTDIWYATNVTGGASFIVTCSFSGGGDNYFALAIHEYSNIAISSPLDVTSTYQSGGTPSANFTTGTSTTHAAGELIFAAMQGANYGSESFTAGPGFTIETDQGLTAGSITEDEIQPSAGAISATATSSRADDEANAMATFEAGSAPAVYSTSTQYITLQGTTYYQYFYLSDVYRDSNGNVTSTITNNYYDPSTKRVTVVIGVSSSTASPINYSFYITRSENNIADQTSWAGGSGQSGAVTVVGTTYAAATSVSVNATGSIQLSGATGGSCTL